MTVAKIYRIIRQGPSGKTGGTGPQGPSGVRKYFLGDDSAARAVMTRLDLGMSAAFGTCTDSTGAGSAGTGWMSPLITLLAGKYTRHRIEVRTVSTTPGDNNDVTLSVINPTQGTTEAAHLYFSPSVGYAAFMSADNQRALPTGDLSIEVELAFEAGALNGSGYPTGGLKLCGFNKGQPTGLEMTSTGNLWLYWRKADGSFEFTGATSTPVPAMTAGTKYMFRVDLDIDDGAGHYVLKYYYSLDSGANWTLLTTRTGGAVTTQAAAAGTQYWIGHYGAAPDTKGFKVYQAMIYNGVGTGTGNSTTRQPVLPARIDAWLSPTGGGVNPPVLGGAPTLYITNLAKSGAGLLTLWFLQPNASDLPANKHYLLADRQEDFWFLAFGHNELGMSAADGYNRFAQLKAMINGQRPTPTAFIHVTQNPETSNVSGGAVYLQQNQRQAMIPSLAAQQGSACVHAYQAFLDDPRGLGALVQPDGVHPQSPAGYALWSGTVFNSVFNLPN